MSLIAANAQELTKKQYLYKLKAYMGLLFSMILVQLVGLLFSFGGVGDMRTHSDGIVMGVKTYSGDIIIIFTFIWAFVIAILFTTTTYRDIDFTLVSNRLTSNLSNIGYLLTISLAGGIGAMLLTFVLKIIVFFMRGAENLTIQNFFLTPYELVIGILAVTFYMILVMSIGYFFGMIAQINRIFVVLIPTFIFGGMLYEARLKSPDNSIVVSVVQFFVQESSFAVFVLKVLMTAAVFFACATLLSDRLEVRK
ncbi:hypothetical protein BHF68_08200 [Desulfuribacillus alkaliarsenatis]|uniref:ABC transporter permease n=2 Tax=Desulfuribacillus alkaliarsenatis TaxID=766136 RepID=A0A1E5G1A8_9FIRM|nr:hypothetical protein BHF68_08200 [Desulfuribacillus alkaliarsenatis]